MSTCSQQSQTDLCSLENCGNPTVIVPATIEACTGFTFVGPVQAAICSGTINCTEESCFQDVEITVCNQTFPCCVEVPLRRVSGDLVVALSAQFEDPCGNPVGQCRFIDVPINFVCPFCPEDAPDCFLSLTPLCEFFNISIAVGSVVGNVVTFEVTVTAEPCDVFFPII